MSWHSLVVVWESNLDSMPVWHLVQSRNDIKKIKLQKKTTEVVCHLLVYTSFPLVSPLSNHSTVTLLVVVLIPDTTAEWIRPVTKKGKNKVLNMLSRTKKNMSWVTTDDEWKPRKALALKNYVWNIWTSVSLLVMFCYSNPVKLKVGKIILFLTISTLNIDRPSYF